MLTVSPERATTVRRRRRGSSLTRQRILTASMHLFSTKGFARTTVRDIARRAGITDAAIYYHFAAKDELLREILGARLRYDRWRAQRTLCANICDLLQEAVHEATRMIEDNHEVLRVILREGLAGNPVAACRYGQLLDDWESFLTGRLLPFESTGVLAAGEARLIARQVMYTIIMAFQDMRLLRPDPSMLTTERRRHTQLFLSRHIEWLLAPRNSPALSNEMPAAVHGRKRTL